MKNIDGKKLAEIILTVFLPPVGVAIKLGFGLQFWINLALTLFGFYIPGIVHGLYVTSFTD
jgi:uncharacterized membrane protein YqaE (UPF0057 family)